MSIFKHKSSFYDYIDNIVKYVAQGKIDKAFLEIETAKSMMNLSLSRQWMLRYYETVITYLYTDDWEWEEMCDALSKLRYLAVEISHMDDGSEENILEEYMSVLYHLLYLNAMIPTELLAYEDVAKEFFSLTEKIDYTEFIDEDLYSFACYIMGIICQLKGQILLEEKYLDIVYQESKKSDVISLYALYGIYTLAETKAMFRKSEEEAEMYSYLMDILMGEKKIEAPSYDEEELILRLQDLLQLVISSRN